MPNPTIFVQVSSYCDPQLPATLRDCVKNARHPGRLHFCVAHQYRDNEDVGEFTERHPTGARFDFIRIPYESSLGACWARNQIQKRYDGEDYTVQLDSHHRFTVGWDTLCIEMIQGLQTTGVEKPLLTAYLPSFDPDADPRSRVQQPWRMNFDRFIPEGVVFFLPGHIPDWPHLTSPIPARFYSAHFTFTLGQHCLEVPHDPHLYFHGEEISLAVRSYTHGYNLFHPHCVVAWHEYTRRGRAKHWDDHQDWHVRNTASFARLRRLLRVDGEASTADFGHFGLGPIRTLQDYEAYAGIRFHDRAVQSYTLSHQSPPCPSVHASDWIYPRCYILSVPSQQVPETDYDFWCVAFHDSHGLELHRQDADRAEIERFQRSGLQTYEIRRSFLCFERPKMCVIWPYSRSKGWCSQIRLTL